MPPAIIWCGRVPIPKNLSRAVMAGFILSHEELILKFVKIKFQILLVVKAQNRAEVHTKHVDTHVSTVHRRCTTVCCLRNLDGNAG